MGEKGRAELVEVTSVEIHTVTNLRLFCRENTLR